MGKTRISLTLLLHINYISFTEWIYFNLSLTYSYYIGIG